MAITLTNADNVLKNYYLGAVAEQLDYKANPFFAKVNKTSNYVYGKEVKKLAVSGVNGGIGAGTEDGSLPAATGNNYAQMTVSLKNLYGTIEISDKAIKASENSAGAFTNLLTAEMEGLVKSGAINFARMLFGDGSGKLGKVVSITDGVITFDAVENFVEGMVIDFRTSEGVLISGATERRVLAVDRTNKAVTVSGTALTTSTVAANSIATVQGSYGNELTGLGAIFGSSSTLYGLSRES
ncbi:MAG: phage major capsid protein, partial [Clostridia bacterium]|nr:phage major capsid protein [Clostridia bacterium]